MPPGASPISVPGARPVPHVLSGSVIRRELCLFAAGGCITFRDFLEKDRGVAACGQREGQLHAVGYQPRRQVVHVDQVVAAGAL